MESPHAEQWQVRSKELRAQAKQMISPEAKSLMLGVADDYEHLTQIAEAMALIRSVLASAIGESRIQDPAMLEPPGRERFVGSPLVRYFEVAATSAPSRAI